MTSLAKSSSDTTDLKARLNGLNFEQRRHFLRLYYRHNLYYFCKEVMGYDLLNGSHRRWEKYITDHIDIANLQKQEKQIFILLQMPRETYKSTFFTTGFVPWALTIDPNLTCLITSATASNAKSWLSAIKKRVQTRTLFRAVFGDWYNRDEWRDMDIIISDRDVVRPESSIQCAGLDSTVTSKHYDIIVADDLVNPQDRDSPAKRTQTIKYLDDLIDLLNKKCGVCLIIGTPWHFDDLYQHIEKHLNPKLREKGMQEFIVIKEPAYTEENGQRKYLFPEILSEQRLEKIRTQKSDIANFSSNYLLKPIHPESQIFRREAFQLFNYHQVFPAGVEDICIHIDPSQSDKKGSDFTAFVAVAKRKSDNKRLVLDAWVDLMRPSKREETAYQVWKYYKDLGFDCRWQIETVAGQEEIRRSLVKYMLDKGVPDFPLRGKPKVANKQAKISSLELPISNGTLLFREDWEQAPNNYRLVVDQLLEFPLGHDDGPDALKEAFDMSSGKGRIHVGVA